MARFTVDTVKLDHTASKMNQHAKDCEKIYNELVSGFGRLGSAWQGADSVEFAAQIKSPLDDLRKMNATMRKYGEFLSYSSKAYRDAQKDVLNAAQRLI